MELERDRQTELFRIGGINFQNPVLVKSHYVKRFCVKTGDFHPGGACRHAGHPNPQHLGPFSKQAVDFFNRDMSFDRIAIHDGCVARLEFGRDLVLGFDRGEVFLVDDFNLKSVFFQILTPGCAASSSGRCVDGDRPVRIGQLGRLSLTAGRKDNQQSNQDHQKGKFLHHGSFK